MRVRVRVRVRVGLSLEAHLQRVGRGDVHGSEVGGDARPQDAHGREVGRRLAANLHIEHLKVVGHLALGRLHETV